MLTEVVRARSRVEHNVFESCALEGPHEGVATIEGAIPAWLRGRLMRVGPGLLELGAYRAAHWFDGLGMVYRLDIGEGRVSFGQRLLETRALAAARTGKMGLATVGGQIERSLLRRIFEPLPPMTDNTNVNIVPTPDGWLAMTETPHQYLVDGESLRITSPVHYRDDLGTRATTMLAHPVWDDRLHQLVNVATRYGLRTEIVAYRHALGERRRIPIGRFTLPHPTWFHSFGLTPKKVIIVAPPMLANPWEMVWSNGGFIDLFHYRPDHPTKVFVIDRRTGHVTTHETDPFFFFHIVQAFDDGDGVVMDLCAYKDASFLMAARTENIAAGWRADTSLQRLRISTRVTREKLDPGPLELPAVDPRSGHRVVFGATLESIRHGSLRRLDLDSGRSRTFTRDDVVYGEPLFVAGPDDEGVILAVGHDLRRGTAELAVLDASGLDPLATARLPIPIPLGIHGTFHSAK